MAAGRQRMRMTQIRTQFFSENEAGPWLGYEDSYMSLKPSGYFLRMEADIGHPRECLADGSSDGAIWTKLCDRRNAPVDLEFAIL
jgi:hypothetical protein